MTGKPVIIAIPARNEAEHIGACLAALASQSGAQQHIAGCAILANNCTDDTIAIATGLNLPFELHVVSAILLPEAAHIGHARRGATDAAVALMQKSGLEDAIIAGTDADSQVAPGWLAALQAAFIGDIDAVCGAIDLDDELPPGLGDIRAAETAYADASARVAAWLDPLPHDPWPNHIWCWGANFAVRAATLAAVGGSPIVDLAEDRALHALLLRQDARIRHSQATRVLTSSRKSGRAPGGFADLMTTYVDDPEALADFFLEPAAVTWRRAAQRGAARQRWGTAAGFGLHWEQHEAATPALARQRIKVADLPGETVRLLARLDAATGRSDIAASAAAPSVPHRALARR